MFNFHPSLVDIHGREVTTTLPFSMSIAEQLTSSSVHIVRLTSSFVLGSCQGNAEHSSFNTFISSNEAHLVLKFNFSSPCTVCVKPHAVG